MASFRRQRSLEEPRVSKSHETQTKGDVADYLPKAYVYREVYVDVGSRCVYNGRADSKCDLPFHGSAVQTHGYAYVLVYILYRWRCRYRICERDYITIGDRLSGKRPTKVKTRNNTGIL